MAVLVYDAAFDALKRGGRVMVTHPPADRVERDKVYALHPSGTQLGKIAVRNLLPKLEPIGDGLFGVDISQTFMLKAGAER